MPSTVIKELAYDPETQTLSVWFRPSGRRYDYSEVPQRVYDALRQSPSKGRYFNAHIRDDYAFEERGPFSPTSPTIPELYHTPVTRGFDGREK